MMVFFRKASYPREGFSDARAGLAPGPTRFSAAFFRRASCCFATGYVPHALFTAVKMSRQMKTGPEPALFLPVARQARQAERR
jgi:hypothetical protein